MQLPSYGQRSDTSNKLFQYPENSAAPKQGYNASCDTVADPGFHRDAPEGELTYYSA